MCSLREYEYLVPQVDVYYVNGTCVAVCCSALQCVAGFCCGRARTTCSLREYEYLEPHSDMRFVHGTCVAVCCRVLRYVAVCCSASPCGAVFDNGRAIFYALSGSMKILCPRLMYVMCTARVLQRVAECCGVLQRVAVCCSV